MFSLLGGSALGAPAQSASSALCSGDSGINGVAGTLAMGPFGKLINVVSGGMLNGAMQGVSSLFGR